MQTYCRSTIIISNLLKFSQFIHFHLYLLYNISKLYEINLLVVIFCFVIHLKLTFTLSMGKGIYLFSSSIKYWRGQWQPTPVLLPGKFHGQRSLVGYSPQGHKESDTTEQLSLFKNYNDILLSQFYRLERLRLTYQIS